MKIQDKACLVSLNISQWTARKYDDKATRTVSTHYETAPDAGRYNKTLVAKKHLDDLTKISGQVRTFHYSRTMPYMVKGQAILATEVLPEYMAKFAELKGQWDHAVEKFLGEYDALRDEARVNLGKLYNDADYPSLRRLRNKFDMSVDFAPIPEGDHLRINVDAEDLRQMQEEIEEKVNSAARDAMADLWGRLYKVVDSLRERMEPDGEDAKTFRDSIVGNVVELAKLLPRMNIAGDADLDVMAQKIERELGQFDPVELRKDKDLRTEAHKKAGEILGEVKSLMSAPRTAVVESEPEPKAVIVPQAIKAPEAKTAPLNADSGIAAKLAEMGIL